jgi:PKD repeat protein
MDFYRAVFKQERKILIVPLLTLLILLLPLEPRAQADTAGNTALIRLESKKIEVGEEAMLKLILASAPTGLQKYDITVSIRDSSIARICCARGVAIAGLYFQIVGQTESSIEFRALDLFGFDVMPGAQDVTLAEIKVVGLKGGRTGIDVKVNLFIDDEGRGVVPQVESGLLEVVSPTPELSPIGDATNPPQDLDGDGLYEDINGDGKLTPEDVSLFAFNIESEVVQTHVECFDFDRDGNVDLDDARALAALVEEANPSLTSLRLEHGRAGTGEEVELNLVLARAPQGLQKYDVVLSVSDSSVVQIKGARSGAIDPSFFQIVQQSPGSVEFRAADLKAQVEPGAEEVVLATIILVGMSRGEAALDIEVKVMADDEGNPIEPLVQSGAVEVTISLSPVGDSADPPRDLDGDGLYEDINGDGELTFADPVLLAFSLDSEVVQQNPALFDFDGDGDVDFNDAVALAQMVYGSTK